MHDLMRDAMAYLTDTPLHHTVTPTSRPSWVTDVTDATTWTYRRDVVPGVGEVITSWHPWPFAPAYGLAGTKKHMQTLVLSEGHVPSDEINYCTEEEAREGHARMVSALKSIAETL